MNQDSTNILVILSKWASAQRENFLTDAFVHLMNFLAQNQPEVFSELIRTMTGSLISPDTDTAKSFTISSQVSTKRGILDIELDSPDSYAIIEVKDESPVNAEQIERYSQLIDEDTSSTKCLILLTHNHSRPLIAKEYFKAVRWTQITEYLLKARETPDLSADAVYVLNQFLGFLEFKGMSLNKVGREIVEGVKQLKNFLVMLKHVAESVTDDRVSNNRVSNISAQDYYGVSITNPTCKDRKYSVFIDFNNAKLVFSCQPEDVIDSFKVNCWESVEGGRALVKTMDLESEENDFFGQEPARQRELLEEFISSSLNQTK